MIRIIDSAPLLASATKDDLVEMLDMMRSMPDQYRQSRQNAGIELERVYFQPTPMGNFVVAYVELNKPFEEANQIMARSDLELDRRFVAGIRDLQGYDIQNPPPGLPDPEVVGLWIDPQAQERLPGHAFCAPVIEGKEDVARAVTREAFEARRAELAEARRSLGIIEHLVTALALPDGGLLASIYVEAKDPVEANRRFATATDPFNTWFREAASSFLPIDFSQPLRFNEQLFDSAELMPPRPLQITLPSEKARASS